MANELRKRKETKPAQPDASAVDTISEPTATPEPRPASETNDDNGTEPTETVKTHIDKKTE